MFVFLIIIFLSPRLRLLPSHYPNIQREYRTEKLLSAWRKKEREKWSLRYCSITRGHLPLPPPPQKIHTQNPVSIFKPNGIYIYALYQSMNNFYTRELFIYKVKKALSITRCTTLVLTWFLLPLRFFAYHSKSLNINPISFF